MLRPVVRDLQEILGPELAIFLVVAAVAIAVASPFIWLFGSAWGQAGIVAIEHVLFSVAVALWLLLAAVGIGFKWWTCRDKVSYAASYVALMLSFSLSSSMLGLVNYAVYWIDADAFAFKAELSEARSLEAGAVSFEDSRAIESMRAILQQHSEELVTPGADYLIHIDNLAVRLTTTTTRYGSAYDAEMILDSNQHVRILGFGEHCRVPMNTDTDIPVSSLLDALNCHAEFEQEAAQVAIARPIAVWDFIVEGLVLAIFTSSSLITPISLVARGVNLLWGFAKLVYISMFVQTLVKDAEKKRGGKQPETA